MTDKRIDDISVDRFDGEKQSGQTQVAAAEKLCLYWLDEVDFVRTKSQLIEDGFKVVSSKLTPCQVMRASGEVVVYATPEVWSRMCVRQGSWYRDSKRFGQYMMMSEGRLPADFDRFLDAEITPSDFKPDALPTTEELIALVESEAYQSGKPDAWEQKGKLDGVKFKIFFTVTRFWKWGDTLKKHWLTHRANHANFLTRHFTTQIEGEAVPYSVAENTGICSSCVQYFNIVDEDSRKLVRACPGSVTFGGTKRDIYMDVNPVRE